MKKTLIVTSLFGSFAAAIVFAADTSFLPEFLKRTYDFPNGDTFGHFILFGTLSLLANLSLSNIRDRPRWNSILVVCGFLSLLVMLEEVSQIFIQTRTFSCSDLLASLTGVWMFGWMVFLGNSLLKRRKNEDR